MKNTPKLPTKTAKFIYVPKNKGESSSKGDADLKSISVHPNCLSIIKEPFATNEFLEFLPKGLIIAKKGETPKDFKYSIEELSAKDGTTQLYLRFYAQLGALNDSACWEATQFFFNFFFVFASVQE